MYYLSSNTSNTINFTSMHIRGRFKGKVYYIGKSDKFCPAGWIEHASQRTWARSHKYCIPAPAFCYLLACHKSNLLKYSHGYGAVQYKWDFPASKALHSTPEISSGAQLC